MVVAVPTTRGRSPAPLVVADRGAAADAPEHTIAALELAIAQGADGIAIDVHLTRDGQPVIVHDFTLERTTDGAGAVRAHSMRELARLDAGGWRAPRFRGQRLQTLQEVLERFRERARFWIELRGGTDLYPGIEERVISMVEIYDVVDRTVVQSADAKTLAAARELNPDVRLATVLLGRSALELGVVPADVRALCADVRDVSAATVAEARGAGLECYVRITGDADRTGEVAAWEAAAILTDRPSQVLSRLGRS